MSDFDLILDERDEDRWNRLIDEINKKNVIPVIGADMLVEPKLTADGEHENIHREIVSFIASQTGVQSKPKTFSRLVFDHVYQSKVRKKEQIYRIIDQVLSMLDKTGIDATPSALLMDLLGTKKFPFVITTSFTPVVETAMEEIWGKGNVRTLQFNNNPQRSMIEDIGDIRTSADMKKPTVFYMFGKYSRTPFSYVVTDIDMMDFCRSWLAGNGVPKKLVEELKKKYLLVLGNNYSDWLFRFVWYSLRANMETMKDDVVAGDSIDDSLAQFLECIETFTPGGLKGVVERIKNGVSGNADDEKCDVFISYSRSDTEVASNLCDSLRRAGLKVWFDADNIGGGADWRQAIIDGINNTKLFVPILSTNIESEYKEVHEYRMEWEEAAEIANRMGARTFIIPFAQRGFDFYNQHTRLPKAFLGVNAVWYASAGDMDEITNVVLREIKEL